MAFVYSFCFWFSLRLGGIIIGVFSLIQGLLGIALFAFAHNRTNDVKEEIETWLNHLHLLFTRDILQIIKEDPDKYITLAIVLNIVYVFLCVLYIYGAYNCTNYLMVGFILAELVRLLTLFALIVTWLLILKHNTMDIGLLIGASVAGGFFLLGMFYLWVCAANLPILINEMERDEQAATIDKLQRMLQENRRPHYSRAPGNVAYVDSADFYRGDVFMPRNNNKFAAGSRIPVSFYR